MGAARWLPVAGVILLAACTPTSGVSEVESNASGGVAPASTLPARPVDGSTPVTPPDESGLPGIAEPDPEIVLGELDNGLRYVVRANDNPGGRVEMRLVVDAGSVLEDDEQSGVAHFLEHMLFNGTERYPENELVDVLRSFGAAFGADINAFTSYDETVYELTMPSDDEIVATGIDVLSQWLSAATIDPDQVAAERGVVLDEWRGAQRRADGRIFDAVEELFLGGTVYAGRDPIGTEAAIRSMTTVPLRRFYDDWYRPDNAAVVVVGDVEPGAVEALVVESFSAIGARSGEPPRPDVSIRPVDEPRAVVHADPDVAEGFVTVSLPVPVPADRWSRPESELQRQVLDELVFDVVATRLANDARRGEAPFDEASVGSSGIVRHLDAPEITVSVDGEAAAEAVRVVLDEYERVRRFGISEAELERAVSTIRSRARTDFEGRNSRQDRAYADEYVRHLLIGEPVPTAEAQRDLVESVLDRASPETVVHGFVERLATAAPHVLVVVPASIGDAAPTPQELVALADGVRGRELEPRPTEAPIPDELMEAPQAAEVIEREVLHDGALNDLIAPTVVTFDNGVRVSFNRTPIVEGSVALEGRSPGGLALVGDDDVADAAAVAAVVAESGAGAFDAVALDAALADEQVELQVLLDSFTEGVVGSSASSDLETLFQLVHLRLAAPRVDPAAVERHVDDQLPYALDPSIDPGYAEFAALLDARYDDPRYLLPSAEALDTVDAVGIERVLSERFGDAGDWVFAVSGDLDVDDAIELARQYLGTLPSSGRVDRPDFVEPPPPPGIVRREVVAGEGAQGSVSSLYTAPATTDRRDDVLAAVVQELLTVRLTDTVREVLGESYSPFAVVQLTPGATPNAEVYVSVTAAVEALDLVAAEVQAQLDSLRTQGPAPDELEVALETVRRSLELFSNEQINDEVLNVLVDPGGNPSFDDFVREFSLVDTIDGEDVAAALVRWLPAERYIEVRVVPR